MKKIREKLSKERLLTAFFALFIIFLVEILAVSLWWSKIQPVSSQRKFNLLILGMGGAGHEASDLTDSLILLLANQETRKILLLSLPRDLWIDSLKTKINSLYHYGGPELVAKETEEIIGQSVNKVLLIDFKTFEKIVDFLGGVEIEVERSFDDFYYPIPGREEDLCDGDPEFACRYEHLHFGSGRQAMDGETALKFARSRNAESEEGSDFARDARQQKVILAIRNKIFSPGILLNPQKALRLARVIQENIQTDINPKDYLPLMKFFLPFWRGSQLESFVLDGGRFGGEGLLYHPRYHPSGQWVLLPVEGNWEKVQEYINQKLNTRN